MDLSLSYKLRVVLFIDEDEFEGELLTSQENKNRIVKRVKFFIFFFDFLLL
tara:strand:- start:4203 stop:4355 length:153 start_codon:yes stop_codon:yes gene_type:complete